ncbi:androglobin-like isoform X2 [Rhopilema esculentum]|uniref:androglobin-like isoform X2 n=1 Tax=Rhopilema esculentum TaxID=499914 RepID=UPI0031E01368|eukprot:gene17147-8682_t
MGSKPPKKKESRERVASAAQKHQEPPTTIPPIFEKDEKGRKIGKVPIPVWPEWSDQDIAAEKWDTGHRVRIEQKGRSPGTSMHFFEEPEGRTELPGPLKEKVHSWRRFQDIIPDGKIPVMVDGETLKGKEIDLLSSSNDDVTDSELMRWIIAGISTLAKLLNQAECDSTCNMLKTKSSKEQRDTKESKIDKLKKESEIFNDELSGWKPWHHIWPKDPSSRYTSAPLYNPGGKYCLKIFWMGCWRKITVDDFVPCDENGSILLPTTQKENELWPLLLCKALIKVASLDYNGGYDFSEMGDSNMIHCLTGWLPEPIPLRYGHTAEIWKLLLDILPKWKLEASESKSKTAEKEGKLPTEEEGKKEELPKLEVKESKEGKDPIKKKEEKDSKDIGNKEKNEKARNEKLKDKEKTEKDGKSKEKASLASNTQARLNTEPEYVIFASYSPPQKKPLRISTLREMADASEKLRQSGLSHNHPHPVHLTMVRNCPLVAPPTPVPIPRWKLIRQKKKTQIVEPPLNKDPPKPPMFVEVASPFINYRVSPIPVSRVQSPVKWKKFKPETPMDSVVEEDKVPEQEEDSGVGTDSPKEGKMDSNDLRKEIGQEPVKPAESQHSSPPKIKPMISIDVSFDGMEKEKATDAAKVTHSKSSSHLKKERTNSGKSNLAETDLLEKKVSRKVSVASSKNELGSARGRKSSKMEKALSEKEVKDTKEAKAKAKEDLKEKEPSEVIPEIELPKGETEVNAENEENEAEKNEEDAKDGEKKEKVESLWMEYDDFCLCFNTLWVFHKSQTYSFYKGHSELKNADQKADKNRRSVLNPALSNIAPTPSGRNPSVASPSAYGSHLPLSDAPMPFLFVDSLSKIELLVSFASFSRWFEPLIQTYPSVKEKENQESEEKPIKETSQTAPPPGLLIAEPYSWKSLVNGLPSLRIKTTGIKGAVLTLPPGRHVLRFMIQAPIGYHIDICSQTSFVFGEEDLIMQHLTKESISFTQYSINSLLGLIEVMTSFNDFAKNRKFNLGSEAESDWTFSRHFEVLFSSFTNTVKTEMGNAFTAVTSFSIEALKYETALCLKRHLHLVDAEKEEKTMEQRVGEEQGSEDSLSEELKRINAAAKIQACFKGHFVRLLAKAREQDSEENKIVTEQFKKIMTVIDTNTEYFALQVYREMFKADPDLYSVYPFSEDEWTRIAYADYNGGYPEQPVNSWFIVFREVFYVESPVLVVPKLYININSCVLRVVDNDTGEQMPMVFMRVTPRVLHKNKNGYTFIAEARSGNGPVPAGKFRLRLIGATDPLPMPVKEGVVNANFTTKEIRDYYLPNRNNVIFRYTAKVYDDHPVSIQVSTSKTDVYVRLDILDDETVVASATGKGHVVLPAFTFLRDHTDDDEEKASHRSSRQGSGRSSVKGSRLQKFVTAKRAASPFEKTGKKSQKNGHAPNQGAGNEAIEKTQSMSKLRAAESSETIDQAADDPEQPQTHKYIIQAVVLRDSWPLSQSQWSFISMLKHIEKTDGEAMETSTKTEKHSAGPKGKKGSKDNKEGRSSKSHQQSVTSRPGSQQFDITKPNWVLRVVSDASASEIEIKKDTERQDQIKAMKAAWEAEQPGRAAKAQKSRMKFLSENLVKVTKSESQEDTEQARKREASESGTEAVPPPLSPGLQLDNDPSELTLTPPSKDQDMKLKPFDITPFIRSTGKKLLLDEKEEERLEMELQERIQKYRELRESVLKDREEDRIARNLEKEKQLQEYEEMQAKLDENRHRINSLREQYRQKFIDQPPADNASEVSKKRKTPSPTRGRKSPRSKSPKEKGKTKSPAKGKKK